MLSAVECSLCARVFTAVKTGSLSDTADVTRPLHQEPSAYRPKSIPFRFTAVNNVAAYQARVSGAEPDWALLAVQSCCRVGTLVDTIRRHPGSVAAMEHTLDVFRFTAVNNQPADLDVEVSANRRQSRRILFFTAVIRSSQSRRKPTASAALAEVNS